MHVRIGLSFLSKLHNKKIQTATIERRLSTNEMSAKVMTPAPAAPPLKGPYAAVTTHPSHCFNSTHRHVGIFWSLDKGCVLRLGDIQRFPFRTVVSGAYVESSVATLADWFELSDAYPRHWLGGRKSICRSGGHCGHDHSEGSGRKLHGRVERKTMDPDKGLFEQVESLASENRSALQNLCRRKLVVVCPPFLASLVFTECQSARCVRHEKVGSRRSLRVPTA